MMSNMNDHEKSVVLAKLCGWYRPAGDGWKPGVWVMDTNGYSDYDHNYWLGPSFNPDFDMYTRDNMDLAWMVLNWAMEQFRDPYPCLVSEGEPAKKKNGDYMSFWVITQGVNVAKLPPAEAQRLWLDKVLELATVAGLVDKLGVGDA